MVNHLRHLSMFFFFNVCLLWFDIATDIATAVNFFSQVKYESEAFLGAVVLPLMRQIIFLIFYTKPDRMEIDL